MEEGIKIIERDIRDLEKIVYRLTESQQITTTNIDKLSADIKEILKNSQSVELLKQEIINMDKRMTKIESSISWGLKILIGAFILGVFKMVTQGGI